MNKYISEEEQERINKLFESGWMFYPQWMSDIVKRFCDILMKDEYFIKKEEENGL